MVIGNQDTGGGGGGAANNAAHPSGIPQDQIDNIMSGIQNTGDVKMNNHRKKLRQRLVVVAKGIMFCHCIQMYLFAFNLNKAHPPIAHPQQRLHNTTTIL